MALVVAVVAAGDANAETTPTVPQACAATTATANAYKMGLKVGEKMVSQAWNRVNDCTRVEYLQSIVEDNVSRLTLPVNASKSVVCRYTGTVDGVYGMLDTLYGTCSDQCFLDGTLAGKLSGEVYCELSIALGGLAEADDFIRGPVQICGLNFEIGCDSEFVATTVTYSNTDGMCLPYTEDSFENVWDQARNNQCAFDPEPQQPAGPDEATQ